MGSLTNFAETAWIQHLCDTAHSPAATVYLCLCTADPGEGATGASMSEVANANNYSRTALSFGTSSVRRITQDADCVFPEASGAWGTVTHWAIADVITYGSGNVLAYGAFTASLVPVSGSTVTVASGQVYVEITASDGEGFTTQYVKSMLELMFDNQAYAQPDTYIALLDTVGADADTTLTTKEIAGTGYARVQLNKTGGSSPAWEDPASGASQNAAAVTFPTVGAGGWSEIVGMAIVDASTVGNVLAYDNDQIVDQTPSEGDTVTFPIGALDISLT